MISFDWQNKLTNFELNENEIHIWLLEFSKIAISDNKFDKILSEDELAKKKKFHFDRDKIVYAVSRGSLRILLSRYLNLSLDEIYLSFNSFGKPFIEKSNYLNIKFNISHSNEFGLLAFNLSDEIGIDIEFINEELVTENIAKNYFSQFENEELFKLCQEDRINAFFNIWTRKEAFIKAIGKGLSIPLNSFDVNISDEKPKILRIRLDNILENLRLYNLPLISNYKSSLACMSKNKKKLNFVKINKNMLN